MGWTLRTPQYRYIEWRKADLAGEKHTFTGEVLATELYDYDKDPLERENVADQPAYAKVLQEHQTLFDRLLPNLPKREP
jgi:hypothetical protein